MFVCSTFRNFDVYIKFLDYYFLDIVCDNAGYELFVDLCFADFLITKKIASKIRFRVKAIPWFVSDVLVRDFTWTIDKICSTHFKREITSDFTLDSSNLNVIGVKWKRYVDEGIWTCQVIFVKTENIHFNDLMSYNI